jgi:hypothetical protein
MKFGATQQLPEIDRWGQMGTDGDRWGFPILYRPKLHMIIDSTRVIVLIAFFNQIVKKVS